MSADDKPPHIDISPSSDSPLKQIDYNLVTALELAHKLGQPFLEHLIRMAVMEVIELQREGQ